MISIDYIIAYILRKKDCSWYLGEDISDHDDANCKKYTYSVESHILTKGTEPYI